MNDPITIGQTKITTDGTRGFSIDNQKDVKSLLLIAKALSEPVRIEIIRLLNTKNMTLTQIANELSIQPSSCAFHLQVLLDAKLAGVQTQRNKKTKTYTIGLSKVDYIVYRPLKSQESYLPPFIEEIQIGDYIDAKVDNFCGMADSYEQLNGGQPNMFFSPKRHDAQIIWSSNACYFVYGFANEYCKQAEPVSINISLEMCSEALGFNEDFPSDVTFSINGVKLGVYTLKGDYGDRYGKYTPKWWYMESTKYGVLVNIKVTSKGVYFDQKLVNPNATLETLNLKEGNKTLFRIEVEENATNKGGLNLMGPKFGDYSQGIIFTAEYN